MKNGKPANTTRSIGVSQGYDELHVVDLPLENGTPCMYTMWLPTTKELTILNQGGMITVAILGNNHPPIQVNVCNIDGNEVPDLGIVQ